MQYFVVDAVGLALLVLQGVELGLVEELGVELDVGLLVVQGFEELGLDEGAEDDRDVVEDEVHGAEEVVDLVVVEDDETDEDDDEEDEDDKTGDADDETDDDELVEVLDDTLLEDEAAGQSVQR